MAKGTPKRPKTKEELVEKMVDNTIEKFKEELKALEEKYGYYLEPALHYSKMGIFPQIEVQRRQKPVTTENNEASN